MSGRRNVNTHLITMILVFCWCGITLANNPGNHHQNKDIVIIGYSSSLFDGADKKDVQAALDIWVNELAKVGEFRKQIEARIYNNLENLVEDIRQKKIDFVAMNLIDYLKIRNKVEIEPALIATNQGRVGEEFALIIHKGMPWTELKQLQGKNLLVEKSSGACNNALLWLDTQLLLLRLPPSQSFFRSVKLVENSSKAVLPVFFRQSDACLMPRWSYDTMVELNPQVKEQTNVLAHSPLLARGGLFMVKGLPPDKREMVSANLKVWRSIRARQLMALFHTEVIVPFQPAHIQTMVKLYNDFLRLTKRN